MPKPSGIENINRERSSHKAFHHTHLKAHSGYINVSTINQIACVLAFNRFNRAHRIMHTFEKTNLWRLSLGQDAHHDEQEARNLLRDRFLDIRKRAEDLVSVIARDVPGLTVHDIMRWTPKFGPVVKLCDYSDYSLGEHPKRPKPNESQT